MLTPKQVVTKAKILHQKGSLVRCFGESSLGIVAKRYDEDKPEAYFYDVLVDGIVKFMYCTEIEPFSDDDL